jgi:AbrB family looped-hinge helix DNA binding protein
MSAAMRTTIDAAGRVVVPKPLRDELGLRAGVELELRAVDGRLEAVIPSRVAVEHGPHGLRFTARGDATLDADLVRALVEQDRR